MGTLRKVKGVHPLMDKGFGVLWYICMGEVQEYQGYVTECCPVPNRQGKGILKILDKMNFM